MAKIVRSTISDVANAANVSVATASRYINGTAYVKPETAERIIKAISALNYHPNQMARALKRDKT